MRGNEQGSGAAPPLARPEPVSSVPNFTRVEPRIPFSGYPFQIRAIGKRCSIRLRDLSSGGASGLCDEPLDIGDFVKICFAEQHIVEAEVRWVHRMIVGLKFTHPLAPGFVRRLYQAHGTFATIRSGK
jgi:hypothetical protein